ncbi:V-type ATP synthase subunit E [Peptoniphilus equinus]|uniref:V-type ATP synthase subunit E n=1 Tax=Peptoniphilus equinus TaxID=3016343 RepID=A0ABY7QSU3_9FIRM|nr:V-type ATP synthase subunit E [Peptoniphilus equinus]WBW49847.1 V-type ATP synthase subunit E [Peptoniphilus equinus]
MSNIETLLAEIEAKAKQEELSIIDAAKKEAEAIVQRAELDVAREEELLQRRGESERQSLYERTISSAQLKGRDSVLKAREATIDEVFRLALEKLNALSDEAYLEVIESTVAKLELKDPLLYVRADKRDFVSAHMTMKLAEETVKSGFSIADGAVVYNNDFGTLLESLRPDIEPKLYKKLRGGE